MHLFRMQSLIKVIGYTCLNEKMKKTLIFINQRKDVVILGYTVVATHYTNIIRI